MYNRQIAGFACAIAFVAVIVPASPGWAQEPPTLDEIIGGLVRAEELFFDNSSLLLRYERTASQDVTPTAYTGGYLLAEWSLAYKGNKWFAERRFTKPVKTKGFEVPGEPMTQVVKDQTLLEWTPYGTSAVIDHFNLGRNIYGGLFYTRNLSLDAPRHIAESNGADIKVVRQQYADDADLPFLPGFLEENKEHYHVLPARDEVDGVPCWVVEWEGMDRFWIDPARGFAVPRRQFCWAPGKPLNYEFLNQDYREVKAGLWLPFTQIENKYASIVAEKESLWGKVAARSEYRLHNIEFDSVPDSLFEVKLPAGTHVIDMVRDFQYAVSGNNDTDPFADEIEEARREISLMTTPTNRHRRWFLIVNLFIGAAAVAAWLYRRWPRNAS